MSSYFLLNFGNATAGAINVRFTINALTESEQRFESDGLAVTP
jgi:hypothetical protein